MSPSAPPRPAGVLRPEALAPRLARAEILLAGILALATAVAVVLAAPPAGDLPAHLYRTLLAREGVQLWDNLWYGGQYPLSYSLLYYLPASIVGNTPIVLVAVVLSAALFASVLVREWGEAGRWPARAFGVLSAGPLLTGTYSYAVGVVFLLAALRALQGGRTRLAVLAAALALGFSPLAFLFLCLILLAVFLARGRLSSSVLTVAAGLTLLAAVEVAAIVLFPSEGRYPFSAWNLAGVLTASILGTALALRAEHGRALAALFLLWGIVSLLAYIVPTPVGSNLTRLRFFIFPVGLLTAFLAHFRPRGLALAALGLAFAYNVVPYGEAVSSHSDPRASKAAFWRPALQFLRENSGPNYRVEVVPISDHWEAFWVPRAGFAMARGWYRQLDVVQNEPLYRPRLSAIAYRRWLRRMAIKYVLLPRTELDDLGTRREIDLLRSGRSGLRRAFTNPDWTIYELPDAVPILTGPGRARLTALGHDRIAGWTSRPGSYRLRVRYTRLMRVRAGRVCLTERADGMTQLVTRRDGRFVLTLGGGAGQVVLSVVRGRAKGC